MKLARAQENPDPASESTSLEATEVPRPIWSKWVTRENFYLSQIGVGFLFIWIALRALGWGSQKKSAFRERPSSESQKTSGSKKINPEHDRLAHSKMKRAEPKRPLSLPGIVLTGAPHEILGVRASASSAEIQKAYRDQMKSYHPDKIGRPGSREWEDAQKIAEALNRARDEMIRGLKSK